MSGDLRSHVRFHQPFGGARSTEIRIRCKFEGLTVSDKGAFAEYVTYEKRNDQTLAVMYVNWRATSAKPSASPHRRSISWEIRSGKEANGPTYDTKLRELLCATYLRPLRDAERAMSAGRGSRLSQILQHTAEIKTYGTDFDPEKVDIVKPSDLSVLGIGDFTNALLGSHKGVQLAREKLNTQYLQHLSFTGNRLRGHMSVSGIKGDADVRRRLLLEKLDLALHDNIAAQGPPNRGLGSNNILFMACELLLLASEADGFPFLLIEEPEAHLHPQRQLRLMRFLQDKVDEKRVDGQNIQILITTHSPNLASTIDLNNLVLIKNRRAYPLASGYTELSAGDYGFLARFLDVTKANLFFARGVLIVEGDAENILIPTLARLIGRSLTDNGVSVVNVGTTGLRRFARIYMRKNTEVINVPVACIADMDVMPDCAAEIVGKVDPSKEWPASRRWRAEKDFTPITLEARRSEIRAKASGQNVETFVADPPCR